jgi:hypothetical protein
MGPCHSDKWVPVTVISGSLSPWQVGPCHRDKWVLSQWQVGPCHRDKRVPATVTSGSLPQWQVGPCHRDKRVPVTVTSGSLPQWQVGPCHRDKRVPVTVTSGSLSPRHGASSGCGWRNGLQIWRVTANVLNKQSRTADRGRSSSLGLSEVLTTPHRKNKRTTHKSLAVRLACGTYEEKARCILVFGGVTWGKETTWKTEA